MATVVESEEVKTDEEKAVKKVVEEENEPESAGGCDVCLPPNGLIGCSSYNYKYLCLPSMPWSRGGVAPPQFLGKDARLPLLLALVMGFQHALAMVAGIATSGGMLIAGDTCFPWQYDSAMCEAQNYLVSAAWITSGILTIIQVFRAKIHGTPYYLGTGLLSVMGTSFTFLPIAREMVVRSIADARSEGKCDGNDCRGFGKKGYGQFLGTAMAAAWFEVLIAFLPAKLRKKMFPTVVTGVAVMLIGVSLISAGIKYVGGGVFCAENDLSRSASFGAPQPCNENGNVVLFFGAAPVWKSNSAREYVGLAFSVIAMSVFLQFFGSPFLKSTFLFWGLMFGCFVAGVSRYEATAGDFTIDTVRVHGKLQAQIVPAVPGRKYKYFNDYRIRNAPWFTFLWDTTFPLGFDRSYFLPMLIGFFVSTAETIGDVTMTCEASRLATEGDDFEARVAGGLLADGINSFLATLFTSPPNTTFSQNNGVIKLTQCASRAAGFACAFWLILFGVFGKLGAAFNSIPICVVGGLVLQCFASVFVSGMIIATKHVTRRNSFIIMISLALGVGVALEPNLFEGGGVAFFYGQNLRNNIGFWPRYKTCKSYPEVTVVTAPASCDVNGYSWTSDADDFATTCAAVSGVFTPAVTESETTRTCANDNGRCCNHYNKREDSHRTTLIILLKTPYAIGTIAALFLHLLLPEDRVLDEEKEGYKRAFSDGEIAYES